MSAPSKTSEKLLTEAWEHPSSLDPSAAWGHRGRGGRGQTPPSHKGVHPGDVCSVSWTHQDPAVGAVTTAENNFKNKETYTTGVPIVVHATVKMVLKFVSF